MASQLGQSRIPSWRSCWGGIQDEDDEDDEDEQAIEEQDKDRLAADEGHELKRLLRHPTTQSMSMPPKRISGWASSA